MTAQPNAGLILSNHAALDARVSFRCGPREVWSVTLVPGAGVMVPSPASAGIEARARVTHAHVRYVSAAVRTTAQGGHVLAEMTCRAQAPCFVLRAEAGIRAEEFRLSNHCRETVAFELRFPQTPFRMDALVPPNTEEALRFTDTFDLSATLNGLTTSPFRIRTWSERLAVETNEHCGEPFAPLLRLSEDYPEITP